MASRKASGWARAQWVGAISLLVGSVGFLVARGGFSNDVPFLVQSDEAPWITAPAGVSARLQQWGQADVPVARFACGLAAASGERAQLLLRALGDSEVRLNGASVPGSVGDPNGWRHERAIDLAWVAGRNELTIDVANRHGPPLLSARIAGGDRCAGAWRVSWQGRDLGPAVIADDTRVNPLAYTVETPAEALADGALAVGVAFALGAIGWLALSGLGAARWFAHPRAPAALFGVVALGWLTVFWRKFMEIPLEVGFDAKHHLFYVDFLREHAAVPMATDGWSVYHPPLFYMAAGMAQWLGAAFAGETGGAIGLKLLPFLAGLANVWVAAALCRRFFPDAAAVVYALALGAVLPMNLYSAAYFSNETFHTLLAGVAMLWVVDLLLASEVRTAQIVRLGVLLGLCAVTKFTALLVVAVGGFFLAVKWLAVDGETPARTVGRLAGIGALTFGIAGWFYVRNWIEYGNPLMANWGSMPGATLAWWQQPGFHTLPYFFGFGESLQHPYLSAFHSFWDSVYSTLWGDGGIAGRVSPADRIAVWNYTFMSLGYWVAVPATGVIALGVARSIAIALRDPDPRRRAAFSFLLTLCYSVLFGLLYLALRLPYFAQGKASYGLVVVGPLAVFFAAGATACDTWLSGAGRGALRAVWFGWLAVFLSAMFLAYAG